MALGVAWLSAMASAALGAILLVGYYAYAQLRLLHAGLVVGIVFPMFAAIIVYMFLAGYRYITEGREKRYLRTAFEHYLNPDVITSLLESPEGLKLGGERRHLAILFADIVSFTKRAERTTPEELLALLNTYMTSMIDVIFKTGGVVDKLMGDGIMAFWGAPNDIENPSRAAIDCALKMLDNLHGLQKNDPRFADLDIGIGISTGDVVVGNLGGENRFDYSVIGDTVNFASRLEGLTRHFKVHLLVSRETYTEAGAGYIGRELGLVKVKGKQLYVPIVHVAGRENDSVDPAFYNDFANALSMIRSGDAFSARQELEQLGETSPDDTPVRIYLEKIAADPDHPPTEMVFESRPSNWLGALYRDNCVFLPRLARSIEIPQVATNDKVKVAVVGASGYSGIEAVRILSFHPFVELSVLTSEHYAGREVADVYRHMAGIDLPPFEELRPDLMQGRAEVAISCLPETVGTAHTAELIKAGVKVIDLSADYRFKDPAQFRATYGIEHPAPQLLKEAVYGLSEFHRQELREARLVANPGCFPTGALLALLPLIRRDLIEPSSIIIDAKSGTTGARRAASIEQLFAEVNDNFRAYKVGNHRHVPEMEQEISAALGRDIALMFVPHLLPITRGMLSSISCARAPAPPRATSTPPSKPASPSRASSESSSPANCPSCATCARPISASSRSSSTAAAKRCCDNRDRQPRQRRRRPSHSKHEPDARLRRSRRPAPRRPGAIT